MKFNFWKKDKALPATDQHRLEEVKSHLKAIEARLVEDIRSILTGGYGLYDGQIKSAIHSYDFELFPDGFGISFYPMDENNTQLGYVHLLPEYPDGFFRDLNLEVYAEDFDGDDDRLDAYYEMVEKTVTDWFILCWKNAGGLAHQERYTFRLHDADRQFSLNDQKWVTL